MDRRVDGATVMEWIIKLTAMMLFCVLLLRVLPGIRPPEPESDKAGVARVRVSLYFYRGDDEINRSVELRREADGEWRVCGNPL
ncbi:hypothetical protein Val02_71680 [Virgisporangium aliadipatigenens]|uniref:Uncharacterized protein n=1 Tax=Virgisporangium aliadipatigenens TaxID=741659 RepID=A0A8J3YTE1_9ACTN|nr:hypothetical protein [Virgisporangium aliadipatigenens]GIJ50282.1 hypothetical protein Val02_71680 [Virgisporangium aliadipatigenens]